MSCIFAFNKFGPDLKKNASIHILATTTFIAISTKKIEFKCLSKHYIIGTFKTPACFIGFTLFFQLKTKEKTIGSGVNSQHNRNLFK